MNNVCSSVQELLKECDWHSDWITVCILLNWEAAKTIIVFEQASHGRVGWNGTTCGTACVCFVLCLLPSFLYIQIIRTLLYGFRYVFEKVLYVCSHGIWPMQPTSGCKGLTMIRSLRRLIARAAFLMANFRRREILTDLKNLIFWNRDYCLAIAIYRFVGLSWHEFLTIVSSNYEMFFVFYICISTATRHKQTSHIYAEDIPDSIRTRVANVNYRTYMKRGEISPYFPNSFSLKPPFLFWHKTCGFWAQLPAKRFDFANEHADNEQEKVVRCE